MPTVLFVLNPCHICSWPHPHYYLSSHSLHQDHHGETLFTEPHTKDHRRWSGRPESQDHLENEVNQCPGSAMNAGLRLAQNVLQS